RLIAWAASWTRTYPRARARQHSMPKPSQHCDAQIRCPLRLPRPRRPRSTWSCLSTSASVDPGASVQDAYRLQAGRGRCSSVARYFAHVARGWIFRALVIESPSAETWRLKAAQQVRRRVEGEIKAARADLDIRTERRRSPTASSVERTAPTT